MYDRDKELLRSMPADNLKKAVRRHHDLLSDLRIHDVRSYDRRSHRIVERENGRDTP